MIGNDQEQVRVLEMELDGLSTSAERVTAASAAPTTTAATTVQLVDEATQSCPSSFDGWTGGNLKACQTSRTQQ
jgi:hypothetical protein